MPFIVPRRAVLLGIAVATAVAIPAPALSTECIAPANTGGGWDFTCRTIGKILYEIGEVEKPVQVVNIAGSGGGIAYSYVVVERYNDEDLIVAASSATATRLAQDAYGGLSYDKVRFLGAIGADPGVIVVAQDSPHKNLNDLLSAVKADPGSVAFAGGSATGGFDHLKVLMALRRVDFKDVRKVKYVNLEGGADAIAQTIGGFTQAMTGDLSEVAGFLDGGDIRVLAVLSTERVPGKFSDIPTAREQGVDVVAVNWRGLYVPKGISSAAYRKWTKALTAVAESEQWQEAMKNSGLAPFTIVGDEFEYYLLGVIEEVAALSREIGIIN